MYFYCSLFCFNVGLSERDTVAPYTHLVFSFTNYSYSRETPKRFKKELIKAACTKQEAGEVVGMESLNQILINIGKPDQRLTEEDMNQLLGEFGAQNNNRTMSIDNMMKLI